MARPLSGSAPWAVGRMVLSGVIGGGLALLYGALELDLVAGHLALFLGLGSTIVLSGSMLARALCLRSLGGLLAVSQSAAPHRPASLQAALREVRALPERAFTVQAAVWVGGAGLLAVAVGLLPAVPWTVGLRILCAGSALGLLTSAGSLLLTRPRARAIEEALAGAGLSLIDAVEAIPSGRPRLGSRLFALAALAVLSPAALLSDLLAHRLAGGGSWLPSAIGWGAVFVGWAWLIATAASRQLFESFAALTARAAAVGRGDLAPAALPPVEDEVWSVAVAFSGAHARLTDVLREIKRAGSEIASTTTALTSMSSRQQVGATEQATALNETMATTEELTRSARQIAESASQVAKMAEQTLGAAKAGQRGSEDFASSMTRMRKDNQSIADSVVRLNKRVQQIGRIIEFINGVADKSDLLALNAELEGTKAGDVGRGFSLVAAEMRRTAENVTASTRQISQLIEEIRDATNAAVMATEAGVKATDVGAGHSAELSRRLVAILDLAGKTSDAVRAISLATQQQQAGTDQLATAMAGVLQVTQQSALANRQLGTAKADLSVVAQDLQLLVGRFRAGSKEASRSPHKAGTA